MSASPPDAGRPLVERAFDLVCRAGLIVGGIALCVIVVTFGWLVYGRYVLNETPTWVEQLALLLVIWISFIVSAVNVREDRHLAVEMFRDALPRRPRIVTMIAADILLLVFGVLMGIYAARLSAFNWDTRIPLLGMPEGLKALPLAICGWLIVVFVTWRLFIRFRELFGRGH